MSDLQLYESAFPSYSDTAVFLLLVSIPGWRFCLLGKDFNCVLDLFERPFLLVICLPFVIGTMIGLQEKKS